MAGCPSYDIDDDCGHAAFDCARFGHRNFFWFHAALEHENFALHRRGVDMQVQQDRGRDRSDVARCNIALNASDLFLAVPDWDACPARPAGTASRVSPALLSRFYDVARLRPRRLAFIIGLAVSGHSQRHRDLLRYAAAC